MKRSDLSHQVIKTLERLPPPMDAHYGVVPSPPPTGALRIDSVGTQLRKGLEAVRRADALAAKLPTHFALTRVLMRQEAVTSSAIEGTNSTLEAVLEVEESEEGDATDIAASQVRDYALALQNALPAVAAKGRSALTLDLIEKLHRDVLANDRGYRDVPGEVRQRVVWIGGNSKDIGTSIFNPPPPNRVGRCLADHIRYLGDDGMSVLQQPIIVRLAIAHAHFEAIHPFRDGNGRVGRLLLPLMMAADGYTPLFLAPYIAHNKSAYIQGLKAAQQRLNYAPLIDFMSEAIMASVQEADATAQALGQLPIVWRARRKFRRQSAALRALDLLVGFPVVTANRLASELHVSFEASNRAISQLVDARILVPLSLHKRNRMFAARDVLRIYNRPFAEPPEIPEA